MRTMLSIGALGAALGLGACATNNPSQGVESVKEHCAKAYADPRLDPLRGRLAMPITIGAPQPIEVLANRDKPSAAERELILLVSKAFDECQRYAVEQLGPPPAYRSATQDRVSEALADLYAGEITYGGFAKTLLYIGEREALAREDLDQAIKHRERWLDLDSMH